MKRAWIDPHELDGYSMSEYVYVHISSDVDVYIKAGKLRKLVELAQRDPSNLSEDGVLVPHLWIIGERVGY